MYPVRILIGLPAFLGDVFSWFSLVCSLQYFQIDHDRLLSKPYLTTIQNLYWINFRGGVIIHSLQKQTSTFLIKVNVKLSLCFN